MGMIKQIILKSRMKNKVIFDKKTKIDKACVFGGANRLARGSELYNVKLEFGSYVGKYSVLENVEVGKFSCIGPRVMNIIGEHPLAYVSMHPAFYSNRKQAGFSFVDKCKFDEFRYAEKERSVIVGNDVWIAGDVRILDGVKIGDGAAVLAGAMVTKDVPPYAIVGGVPAKMIRYRFSDEQINDLLNMMWWDKSEAWIRLHAEYFDNVQRLIEKWKEES